MKAVTILAIAAFACRPVVIKQPERPAWQYVLDVMAALAQPPTCALHDLPERPDRPHLFDQGDDDPLRRYYVLKREWEEYLDKWDDLWEVVRDQNVCLHQLSTDGNR